MSSIFLSHNNADKSFARRLTSDLRAAGVRVWFDEAELKIGDSLFEKIQQAIDETEYLGVILSANSVRSRWVQREVHMAMDQEVDEGSVKVLPLLIQDCELPGFLRGKLYADFRSESMYQQELEKVLDRLNSGNVQENKTIRLTAHQARFANDLNRHYYFINVTNISEKPIEMTHAWYENGTDHVRVNPRERPLPARLDINEPWATWIAVDDLPEQHRESAFDKFRVRLSTGDIFTSRREENIPPIGSVPGGVDPSENQ